MAEYCAVPSGTGDNIMVSMSTNVSMIHLPAEVLSQICSRLPLCSVLLLLDSHPIMILKLLIQRGLRQIHMDWSTKENVQPFQSVILVKSLFRHLSSISITYGNQFHSSSIKWRHLRYLPTSMISIEIRMNGALTVFRKKWKSKSSKTLHLDLLCPSLVSLSLLDPWPSNPFRDMLWTAELGCDFASHLPISLQSLVLSSYAGFKPCHLERLTNLEHFVGHKLDRLFYKSLPSSLERFSFHADNDPVLLPDFPPHLTDLHIDISAVPLRDHTKLSEYISWLPKSLTSLKIDGWQGGEIPSSDSHVTPFPPYLETLEISRSGWANSEHLRINIIPESLKRFKFAGHLIPDICKPLMELLPSDLTHLDIAGCQSGIINASIRKIPRSVTSLALRLRPNMEKKAELKFPPHLTTLSIDGNSNFITDVLSFIPSSVLHLTLHAFKDLEDQIVRKLPCKNLITLKCPSHSFTEHILLLLPPSLLEFHSGDVELDGSSISSSTVTQSSLLNEFQKLWRNRWPFGSIRCPGAVYRLTSLPPFVTFLDIPNISIQMKFLTKLPSLTKIVVRHLDEFKHNRENSLFGLTSLTELVLRLQSSNFESFDWLPTSLCILSAPQAGLKDRLSGVYEVYDHRRVTIDYWPTNLHTLHLHNLDIKSDDIQLPASITSLTTHSTLGIYGNRSLSSGLLTLNCHHLKREFVKFLPRSLTRLSCLGLLHSDDLRGLPSSLTYFKYEGAPLSEEIIDVLPKSVTCFDVTHIRLNDIQIINKQLEKHGRDNGSSKGYGEIVAFPQIWIETVWEKRFGKGSRTPFYIDCDYYSVSLTLLPKYVKSLIFTCRVYPLTSYVPNNFPSHIVELDLRKSTIIDRVFFNFLPPSLTSLLFIANNSTFDTLKLPQNHGTCRFWPKGLLKLVIHKSPPWSGPIFSTLPPRLQILHIFDGFVLASDLAHLPQSITDLNLPTCVFNKTILSSLPASLRRVNFKITSSDEESKQFQLNLAKTSTELNRIGWLND